MDISNGKSLEKYRNPRTLEYRGDNKYHNGLHGQAMCINFITKKL